MDKIVGKRVYLRQLEVNDFQTFLLFKKDHFINKYMFWPDKTNDDIKIEFDSLLNEKISNIRNLQNYHYFICLQSTQEIIGFTSIKSIYKNDFGGLGDIGYFLKQEFCHKGYAKEAIKLLINTAFDCFGFHKLSAFPFTENANSINFLEKNSFNKEALLIKEAFIENEWKNISIYSVYKDTWIKH